MKDWFYRRVGDWLYWEVLLVPVILAEKGLPGMCLSLYLTRML